MVHRLIGAAILATTAGTPSLAETAPLAADLVLAVQGETILKSANAIDTTKAFVFAIAADNPKTPGHRIGISFTCPGPRSDEKPELVLQHGFFPSHPVQSWVRRPGSAREHLGQALRGTAQSGFHLYAEDRPDEITRLANLLLRKGARAGDGNVAWENTRSDHENATLRSLVNACFAPR